MKNIVVRRPEPYAIPKGKATWADLFRAEPGLGVPVKNKPPVLNLFQQKGQK